jgi:hypothetical protein
MRPAHSNRQIGLARHGKMEPVIGQMRCLLWSLEFAPFYRIPMQCLELAFGRPKIRAAD